MSTTSLQEEESQTAKLIHTSTVCNESVHYHTPTTVIIHQQQIVQHTQYIIVRILTNNTSVYKQRSRKKSSLDMIQNTYHADTRDYIPSIVTSHAPVTAFQMRTVLSLEPDTIRLPSRKKHTDITSLRRPVNRWNK